MTEAVFNALKRARELISERPNWTQGVRARDADGRPVEPESSTAVCWCATGAIHHIAPTSEVRRAAVRRLDDASRNGSASKLNDNDGYAATLRMFDVAIATEVAAQAEAP